MNKMFIRTSLSFFALCTFAGTSFAQSPVTVTPATANAAQSVEIKEMQKLEDQWSDAIVKRDQYGLELLLSPLYVGISANGEVSTRNQQITLLFNKTTDPLTMEQRVISARMLGDVAVVNGTYIMRRKNGSDTLEERGIFTHVYQRVRSNWLCINSQRTVVAEESGAKQKVSKKSNADLPFHVPFLFKGADSAKQQQQPGPAQSDAQAAPQPQ
jgi:hypothetical protein